MPSKEPQCFEASVELLDGSTGMNCHALFLADSYAEAIKCAVAWAKNRSKNLKLKIGAVSVCGLTIPRPEASGYIPLMRGFAFFEWKCDFPGTLDAYAADAPWALEAKDA